MVAAGGDGGERGEVLRLGTITAMRVLPRPAGAAEEAMVLRSIWALLDDPAWCARTRQTHPAARGDGEPGAGGLRAGRRPQGRDEGRGR